MDDLQPAIDLLEQEAAAIAHHLAQSRQLPALAAVQRRTGLERLNAGRLTSYRRAVEILRTRGAAS